MFKDGFPMGLCEQVSKVVNLIPLKTYSNVNIGTSGQRIHYVLNGESINFPDRMYYWDVSDETLNKLTLQQQMILHCIYTRSCDGFIRQRHLQALLLMRYEDWAIPYIVKVCDEYVVEILEITYDMLKEQNTELIKEFCFENAKLFCKSYARMISYWNEFYRDKYYRFNEYIGKKLFRECFGYTRTLERRL